MSEDFTLPIKVGGSAVMFAPNPKADPHIEWSLRYSANLGDPSCGRFSAAAVVESFAYLLSDNINMTEATRRLRLMRAAVREHVAGVTEPLIGASEPPGSVQCSVCKAITAPGNGCSAEDCTVGVPAVEAPNITREQLTRWHDYMAGLMEKAGVDSSDVIAEVFRAVHEWPGPDGVPPSQDERTRQFFADVASSPEKARSFLQDAGILDERGDLAEPYRADGVPAAPAPDQYGTALATMPKTAEEVAWLRPCSLGACPQPEVCGKRGSCAERGGQQ